MSTVYVIQEQMHLDRIKQQYVPRFDLSPAEEYGNLEYLLSPTAGPFHTGTIIKELKEALIHYTPEDYLLLVGNPVLIGLTTAIVAQRVGEIQFLQWSGKDQRYIPIKAKLF